MNYQTALELAQAHVERYYKQPMWLASVIAKPYGWAFHFETLDHVESGNPELEMEGNVSVMVFRSGEVCDIPGSMPTRRFFDEWEKYAATGTSPIIEHLMKLGSKLPHAAPEN